MKVTIERDTSSPPATCAAKRLTPGTLVRTPHGTLGVIAYARPNSVQVVSLENPRSTWSSPESVVEPLPSGARIELILEQE